MIPITMEYLENCFKRAKEINQKFVAVRIEMEGFPEAEIIVNPIANADSKLFYYKNTYGEELHHKHAKGIKITGFTFGNNMGEIEEDLVYW